MVNDTNDPSGARNAAYAFARDMLRRNTRREPTDEEVEQAGNSVLLNLQPMSVIARRADDQESADRPEETQ